MKLTTRKSNILALLLILSMTLFVMACGETDGDAEEDDTTGAASFSLELDDVNSMLTVEAGQAVEVAFTVENTGTVDGTATVTFTLGDVTDTTDIDVAAGSAEGGSFTWTTALGDVGTYTAEVTLGETTVTADVEVEELPVIDAGAFFEMEIDMEASTLEVTEGDPLTIIILGVNTGTAEGIIEISGQITMEGGGVAALQLEQQGEDANSPVAPNQGIQIQATLPTGPGEQELSAGTHTILIESQHDSVSAEIVVNAPEE